MEDAKDSAGQQQPIYINKNAKSFKHSRELKGDLPKAEFLQNKLGQLEHGEHYGYQFNQELDQEEEEAEEEEEEDFMKIKQKKKEELLRGLKPLPKNFPFKKQQPKEPVFFDSSTDQKNTITYDDSEGSSKTKPLANPQGKPATKPSEQEDAQVSKERKIEELGEQSD